MHATDFYFFLAAGAAAPFSPAALALPLPLPFGEALPFAFGEALALGEALPLGDALACRHSNWSVKIRGAGCSGSRSEARQWEFSLPV